MPVNLSKVETQDDFQQLRIKVNLLFDTVNYNLLEFDKNLSDVKDLNTVLTNLNVYSKSEVYNKTEADDRFYEQYKLFSEYSDNPQLFNSGDTNSQLRRKQADNLDMYIKSDLLTKTVIESTYLEKGGDTMTGQLIMSGSNIITFADGTNQTDLKQDGSILKIFNKVLGGGLDFNVKNQSNTTVTPLSIDVNSSGSFVSLGFNSNEKAKTVVDGFNVTGILYSDELKSDILKIENDILLYKNTSGSLHDALLENSNGTHNQRLILKDDTSGNDGLIVEKSSNNGSTWTELFRATLNEIQYKGFDIYHTGNKPTKADVGLPDVDNYSRAHYDGRYVARVGASTAEQIKFSQNNHGLVFGSGSLATNDYYLTTSDQKGEGLTLQTLDSVNYSAPWLNGNQSIVFTNRDTNGATPDDEIVFDWVAYDTTGGGAGHSSGLSLKLNYSFAQFGVKDLRVSDSDGSNAVKVIHEDNLSIINPSDLGTDGIYSKTESDARYLLESNNLSDLTNKTSARTNLEVYSKTESDARYLLESNNLSDLTNKTSARTNLEVYSTNEIDSKFNNTFRVNNLMNEVLSLSSTDKQTLLDNLDVYSRSTIDSTFQTGATTYLTANNNLNDLASPSTSRSNLGLGNTVTWNFRGVSKNDAYNSLSNFNSVATGDHQHYKVSLTTEDENIPLSSNNNGGIYRYGSLFQRKSVTALEIGLTNSQYTTVNTIANSNGQYASNALSHQLIYFSKSTGNYSDRIGHRVAQSNGDWSTLKTIAYLDDTVENSNKLGGFPLSHILDYNNLTNVPTTFTPSSHNSLHDNRYLRQDAISSATKTVIFSENDSDNPALVIGGGSFASSDSSWYFGNYGSISDVGLAFRNTYTGTLTGNDNAWELFATNGQATRSNQNQIWNIKQSGKVKFYKDFTLDANFINSGRSISTEYISGKNVSGVNTTLKLNHSTNQNVLINNNIALHTGNMSLIDSSTLDGIDATGFVRSNLGSGVLQNVKGNINLEGQFYWGNGEHKLFNNDGGGNSGIRFGLDYDGTRHVTTTNVGKGWEIECNHDSTSDSTMVFYRKTTNATTIGENAVLEPILTLGTSDTTGSIFWGNITTTGNINSVNTTNTTSSFQGNANDGSVLKIKTTNTNSSLYNQSGLEIFSSNSSDIDQQLLLLNNNNGDAIFSLRNENLAVRYDTRLNGDQYKVSRVNGSSLAEFTLSNNGFKTSLIETEFVDFGNNFNTGLFWGDSNEGASVSWKQDSNVSTNTYLEFMVQDDATDGFKFVNILHNSNASLETRQNLMTIDNNEIVMYKTPKFNTHDIYHKGNLNTDLLASINYGVNATNFNFIGSNNSIKSGFYTTSGGILKPDGNTLESSGWHHILNFNHNNSDGHDAQIAIKYNEKNNPNIKVRTSDSTSYGDWVEFWHSGNFNKDDYHKKGVNLLIGTNFLIFNQTSSTNTDYISYDDNTVSGSIGGGTFNFMADSILKSPDTTVNATANIRVADVFASGDIYGNKLEINNINVLSNSQSIPSITTDGIINAGYAFEMDNKKAISRDGSNDRLGINTFNDYDYVDIAGELTVFDDLHVGLNGNKLLVNDNDAEIFGRKIISNYKTNISDTQQHSSITKYSSFIAPFIATSSGRPLGVTQGVVLRLQGYNTSNVWTNLYFDSVNDKIAFNKNSGSGASDHTFVSTEKTLSTFESGGNGGIIAQGEAINSDTIRFVLEIGLNSYSTPTLEFNNSGSYTIDTFNSDGGIGVSTPSGGVRTDVSMNSTTIDTKVTVVSNRSNGRYIVFDYDVDGGITLGNKYFLTGENINSILTVS